MQVVSKCAETASLITSYIKTGLENLYSAYKSLSTILARMERTGKERIKTTYPVAHDISMPAAGIKLAIDLISEEIPSLVHDCRAPTTVNLLVVQSMKTDILYRIIGELRMRERDLRILADKPEITREDLIYNMRLLARSIKDIGIKLDEMLHSMLQKLAGF